MSAFGVTIESSGAKAAEKPVVSRNRKAFIWLVVLVAATSLVFYLQYRNDGDPDPDVAAHPEVKAVMEMEQRKDTAGLTQLAHSGDSVVALRAVTALANVGGVDALSDSLVDDRPEVRAAAVSKLGERADVGQLPQLSQYLRDPDTTVRIAAIRGVAGVRDFSIFDHLIPMLSDGNPSVRRGALAAIEERIGLKFSDFDPTASGGAGQQTALARIRSTIPKFRQRFETANQVDAKKDRK